MTIRKTTAWLLPALFAATVLGAAPASAQPAWFTREFLANFYTDLAADAGPARTYLEGILGGPIIDSVWAIMERHNHDAIVRPGFVDFAYLRMLDLIADDATPDHLIALDTILQSQAVSVGILRLAQKKQEIRLRWGVSVRWIELNEPDICPLMADEKADPLAVAAAGFRSYAGMDLALVDHYLAVAYEALAAEVDGFPALATLPDDLTAQADFLAYGHALEALITSSPRFAEIQAFIVNGEVHDHSIACYIGRLGVEAIWALPPDSRRIGVLSVLGLLPDY